MSSGERGEWINEPQHVETTDGALMGTPSHTAPEVVHASGWTVDELVRAEALWFFGFRPSGYTSGWGEQQR